MKIDILCLGTPSIVGDAVAPIVGSMVGPTLEQYDVKVIGTLDHPVIQPNYTARLMELRPDASVLVVDAGVGPNVGTSVIRQGPLIPGDAVKIYTKDEYDRGKQAFKCNNTPIGDASILCFTGATLQDVLNAKFSMVMPLALKVSTDLIGLISTGKIGEYI